MELLLHTALPKLTCSASKLLVRAEALALSLSKGLLEGSMQLPRVPIFNRHIDVTALFESDSATRSGDLVHRVLHMMCLMVTACWLS